MWPFRKPKPPRTNAQGRNFVPLPFAELTSEERDECQRFINSLTEPGMNLCVPSEHAEMFKRGLIALSLIGRAERLMLSGAAMDACNCAAKACTIYPLSIYFYDFGRLLVACGKDSDAKTMFAEFLRRNNQTPLSPLDDSILKQRDLPVAMEEAAAFLEAHASE